MKSVYEESSRVALEWRQLLLVFGDLRLPSCFNIEALIDRAQNIEKNNRGQQ